MRKTLTRLLVAFISILFVASMSFAQESCEAKAAAKKLKGAAKNSFIKKCESDAKVGNATAKCESMAKDKKLAGAAKNSFMKKCVADQK